MAKKKKKYPNTQDFVKLQAELKKREAVEEERKLHRKNYVENLQEMNQIGKERAELKSKVKSLRWKQSKTGQAVGRGTAIVKNIGHTFHQMGVVAGRVGEGFDKAQKNLKKTGIGVSPFPAQARPTVRQPPVSSISALIGTGQPQQAQPQRAVRQVAQPKPFNLNEAMANMNRQVSAVAGLGLHSAPLPRNNVKQKVMKKVRSKRRQRKAGIYGGLVGRETRVDK